MDRYEVRRLALKALVDELGRGGRAEVAKRIGKDPSYVARMLYPAGKEGRKRIGDELVEAITRVYPRWLGEAPAASRTLPVRPARPGFQQFELIAQQRGGDSQAIERIELSEREVRRQLGYLPEPGRVKLFAHAGPSMRPLLEDGDTVMIDTAVSAHAGDDYYLLSMAGDLQIKQLQRRGTELWVISKNGDYPAWRADSDISVIGRALLRICLRQL